MPYQHQLLKAHQRASTRYKEASPVIEEIAKSLLSRLTYFRFPPKKIAELSYHQTLSTQLLNCAYPEAEITPLDFSLILKHQLPFPAQHFDLLYANLLMPAIMDYQSFWQECLRVLKPGGILLFSGLGSETLKELRHCLNQFHQADSVNAFPDMHDIGDGLVSAGFHDPAIESEQIELHYSSLAKLLNELKNLGSIKIWEEYPHLYYGKNFWPQLEKYYQKHFCSDKGKLIATVEASYAIAFAPAQRAEQEDGVSISISEIKRKK